MTRIFSALTNNQIVKKCLLPFRRSAFSTPAQSPVTHTAAAICEASVNTWDLKSALRAANDGKKGKVVTKPGTSKLYYDFNYNGRRIEKSSGLRASSSNVFKTREELDDIMYGIRKNTFVFAARFPSATQAEKAYHAQFETKHLNSLQPHEVRFRDFVLGTKANKEKDGWLTTRLPSIGTENTRFEYERDIRHWLVPLYGDLTFAEITGDKMHESLQQMIKADGESLSEKRIRNVLIPFRKIWYSARSQYKWEGKLPDPFQYLSDMKCIPKSIPKKVPCFRMHEWIKIHGRLDEYHSRVTLIMLLTGMINSEISGLRKQDVELGEPTAEEPGAIHIRYKKTIRGEEGEKLKTVYRTREFPLTDKLRSILAACIQESPDDFVFTMKNGTPYSYEALRYAWCRALAGAGIDFRRLYSLRHSFAAWCFVVGIDIVRLEALMGHGSKQMLFERYGKYVAGLEKDKTAIIEFFGEDFR